MLKQNATFSLLPTLMTALKIVEACDFRNSLEFCSASNPFYGWCCTQFFYKQLVFSDRTEFLAFLPNFLFWSFLKCCLFFTFNILKLVYLHQYHILFYSCSRKIVYSSKSFIPGHIWVVWFLEKSQYCAYKVAAYKKI